MHTKGVILVRVEELCD